MFKISIKYALIIFITSYYCNLHSQTEYIDHQDEIGVSSYHSYSLEIKSFNQIPENMQEIIILIFRDRLGNIDEKLTFYRGYIVDLEGFFQNTPNTGDRKWIVPKFDLNFIFSDTLLRIKSYAVELHLDSFGQILKFNLPHKGTKPKVNKIIRIEDAKIEADKYASEYGYKIQSKEKIFCN